ncbi:TonB-dependent siderophore receptor, partial [Nitrosomonas sp.]
KTTKGLTGSFTVQEGFAQLLRGQGLQVIRNAGGVYSLQVVSASSVESGNTTTLPVMVVAAAADRGITTEGTGSYTTSQSSYGKGQTLRELPQTVTVMTRQRIDDQQLKTVDDVLAYTPGVTVRQDTTMTSSFFSRGFQITNYQIEGNSPLYGAGLYNDGLNTSQLDLAMFDHVEVLRGSDALYGTSGAPGGAINLVRKKPTKQFQVKALAHAGSWNNYRGELDVSGSIMTGRIRGRLVGVYEDRKYFYDYGKSDKYLFYGIVEADVTDSTLLTVGADVMRQDQGGYMSWGLPRYSNGEDLGLRRSFYFGGPDDRWLKKNNKQFVRLDQAIGTNWTLGIEASRAESRNSRTNLGWFGPVDPILLTGPEGYDQDFNYNETQQTLDAVLKGAFHLLGREHKLTLGANINRRKSPFIARTHNLNRPSPNIFEFDLSDYASNDLYILSNDGNPEILQKGVYGSLVAQIADPLKLILGGRLSWYKYSNVSNNFDQNTGAVRATSLTKYEDNMIFTPFLGAVYDITKQWSTYGSIAETYQSQANSLKGPRPGTPLDPITGRTYEIGVKGSLFNERLNTNLAFFSIKRNGQAVSDPDNPPFFGDLGSSCCYLEDGRITSRGVDIEISGEIVSGWQIQAGYTFNDNQNKADSGRYSTITPKHLFKLWSSYELRDILSGLKLGGGLTAQSSNYQKGSARTYSRDTEQFDGPLIPFEFSELGV